jgi:hypothetical protein
LLKYFYNILNVPFIFTYRYIGALRRVQLFDTKMRDKEWGWRGVMGYISPAVVLSYGSEIDYKLGLLGFGTMQITLGLVNATDDNLGKVLPGLDCAAKTLADQGA